MVLEWLLIVAAIAGLGASSVLVVRRVLDTTTDRPTDAAVLLIEADIAATKVAADFAATVPLNLAEAQQRCSDIARSFRDVVDTARWEPALPAQDDNPATPQDETDPGRPARCHIEPRT